MGGKKQPEKNRKYEKERRNRFNSEITHLCKLLPVFDNTDSGKVSKVDIISGAIKFVKEIVAKNLELQKCMDIEKSKCSDLQKKYDKFMIIIHGIIELLNQTNIKVNIPQSFDDIEETLLHLKKNTGETNASESKEDQCSSKDSCTRLQTAECSPSIAETVLSNMQLSNDSANKNCLRYQSSTANTNTLILSQPGKILTFDKNVSISSTIIINNSMSRIAPTLLTMDNISTIPVIQSREVSKCRKNKLILSKSPNKDSSTKLTFMRQNPISTTKSIDTGILDEKVVPVKRRVRRSKGVLVNYPKKRIKFQRKKYIEQSNKLDTENIALLVPGLEQEKENKQPEEKSKESEMCKSGKNNNLQNLHYMNNLQSHDIEINPTQHDEIVIENTLKNDSDKNKLNDENKNIPKSNNEYTNMDDELSKNNCPLYSENITPLPQTNNENELFQRQSSLPEAGTPKGLTLSFDDRRSVSLNYESPFDDIFTSLHTQNSISDHHADSISPTTTFLMNFPLVSNSKNVDHEPEDGNEPESLPTMLQINNGVEINNTRNIVDSNNINCAPSTTKKDNCYRNTINSNIQSINAFPNNNFEVPISTDNTANISNGLSSIGTKSTDIITSGHIYYNSSQTPFDSTILNNNHNHHHSWIPNLGNSSENVTKRLVNNEELELSKNAKIDVQNDESNPKKIMSKQCSNNENENNQRPLVNWMTSPLNKYPLNNDLPDLPNINTFFDPTQHRESAINSGVQSNNTTSTGTTGFYPIGTSEVYSDPHSTVGESSQTLSNINYNPVNWSPLTTLSMNQSVFCNDQNRNDSSTYTTNSNKNDNDNSGNKNTEFCKTHSNNTTHTSTFLSVTQLVENNNKHNNGVKVHHRGKNVSQNISSMNHLKSFPWDSSNNTKINTYLMSSYESMKVPSKDNTKSQDTNQKYYSSSTYQTNDTSNNKTISYSAESLIGDSYNTAVNSWGTPHYFSSYDSSTHSSNNIYTTTPGSKKSGNEFHHKSTYSDSPNSYNYSNNLQSLNNYGFSVSNVNRFNHNNFTSLQSQSGDSVGAHSHKRKHTNHLDDNNRMLSNTYHLTNDKNTNPYNSTSLLNNQTKQPYTSLYSNYQLPSSSYNNVQTDRRNNNNSQVATTLTNFNVSAICPEIEETHCSQTSRLYGQKSQSDTCNNGYISYSQS